MSNSLFAAVAEPAAQAAEAVNTNYSLVDVIVFFGFIIGVIAIGIFMSREKKGAREGSESYFLAGRGLAWWLIGFSLIAANISTEQFVGMSGSAARITGLAIAGYEWLAAITLVFVAFFFLPKFLKSGVYTIPEFLEKRYGPSSRFLMSLTMVVILVAVNITAVIYSGAKVFDVMLGDQVELWQACWAIGIVSMIYVLIGGLKACAWADLIQGSALIIGGAIILYLALGTFDSKYDEIVAHPSIVAEFEGKPEVLKELKDKPAIEKFMAVNEKSMHTIRPKTDPEVPWTALLIGLWIPNLYYWGLNQYIMQRAFGAKSLAQGQNGIVFAAGLKLLIPFIVVFPGIMALNLYKDNHLGYETNMQSEAKQKTNLYTVAIFENASKVDLPSFDRTLLDKTTSGKKELAESEITAEKVESGKLKIVFKFDENFAFLYPEDTAKIVEYNSRYLPEGELDSISDETVLKSLVSGGEQGKIANEKILKMKNDIILAAVKKHNEKITGSGLPKMGYAIKSLFKGNPADYIEEQKELIGYDTDAAFPLLLKNLVHSGGMKGFILAALMGAVMSSLASMLNAASTMMTMDLYKQHINPKASEMSLVLTGRVLILIFVIIGCVIAPMLGNPRFGGVFTYIQEFQGFISPGILAVFLFGFFVRKAPKACGITGLIASPVIYGILKFTLPVAFLDRMAITFAIICALLTMITVAFPRKEKFVFSQNTDLDMTESKTAKVIGVIIILVVVAFYVVFR